MAQTELWHSMDHESVMAEFRTSRSGLTPEEVSKRLAEYGPNELTAKKKKHPIVIFLRQFLSPLVYVLLAAAVIELVVGKYVDAGVIMAALTVMAVIGFTQEIRAERAMEALMQLAAPRAKVRRNGVVQTIPARDIVPGDILVIEAGDKIPADARIIQHANLRVDEAAFTGESMPVDKIAEALSPDLAIADRRNMLYMGTASTYGRAAAVVTSTGMATEIGKITSAIQEVKPEKTPLQRSISRLGHVIIGLVLGTCTMLVIVGYARGLEWLEVFLLAVAAAVSAIPEGLPAVVTVVLAIGMRAMANRNAIIRELAAVETLGSATVICTDKTGTLTLNQMTVRRIYVDGRWLEVTGEGYQPQGSISADGKPVSVEDEKQLATLLRIGSLCNDAQLTRDGEAYGIMGDPTEGALIVAAAKAGLEKDKLEAEYPRLAEIPFQSEKQYMATLHPVDGGKVAYVKGAPERLLSMSRYVLKNGSPVRLDDEERQALLDANTALAGDAMRVMAVAYADLPAGQQSIGEEDIRGSLTIVGLLGMSDPPRPDAREAVRLCTQAGIKVVMITGDHALTAESIARQLRMPPGKVVAGVELGRMSDEDLAQQVEDITVFARVEPLHKLRIVRALKSKGNVVAMTGDGINDAPALRSAEIGIAMGITGTDVAKDASDMVLTDDNFGSIVAAVEEGRAIFNRLRNVLFFLISTNMAELLALTVTVAVVGKAPLLALQIIWVNLVTDTAAALPLGVEPKAGDELKQPPRHPKVGLLFPGLFGRIAFLSGFMATGVFLVFYWAQQRMSLEEARTVAFCSMVVFEWFRAFNARSDEHTIFKLGVFRNRALIISISIAVMLQIAVVYVPFLQVAFGTVPLSLTEWGIALIPGASLFIIEELRKFLFPRLFNAGKWQPARPFWRKMAPETGMGA